MTWRVIEGDCVRVMAEMAEASIDAIVTDPPYGLHFMGQTWDRFGGPTGRDNTTHSERGGAMKAGHYDLSPRGQRGFQEAMRLFGVQALRVLKPGGHLVSFGGTRTYHRLASGLEDAGFEIRDTLAWLYGSGFPKSLNLEGEWEGWGTALKPAFEPIVLARRPLEGTVAQNVQTHGTGALNVDGCRIDVGTEVPGGGGWASHRNETSEGWDRPYANGVEAMPGHSQGRWPANVVLDDEAAEMVDEQSGDRPAGKPTAVEYGSHRDTGGNAIYGRGLASATPNGAPYGDTGGVSRFFYVPKADREERNRGVERNTHPTVKPVALMSWLVRLVTPPKGTVLDPFLGSGTTGIAALREGFDFIGIEREPDYVSIARDRIIGDGPLLNVPLEVTQ